MTSRPRRPSADPVGLADIAKRLDVRRQTAKEWKRRNLLPEPRWHASDAPLWDWDADIEPWARKTGRLKPPEETARGNAAPTA